VDGVLGGRYRLQERLGQGGTGEVYRAFDERLERPVAVKIMHARVADDREARERFRREATLMARLRHRNIVGIHDYDNGADRPYLVQEYCPGGTIGLMVEAAPLPWERVRSIALPILAALEHAHAAGVIHRDLKPTNVLYAADGTLAVGDFGLARAIAGQTLTADGAIVGTPEYWSPEQAANQPVTEKTDIYALGCILYQLATGSLPFTGEDRLAVGWARTHEQPVPAIERNPLLPDEADELIRSLMETDPAKRPRAGEVLARLGGRPAPAPRGTETIAIADEATFVAGGDEPRTERIAGVDETLAVPPPAAASPVIEVEREPDAEAEAETVT
jgi:serine/threonine protein kinase